MDRYVKEFTFRLNHRAMTNAMFDLLIRRCSSYRLNRSVKFFAIGRTDAAASSWRTNLATCPVLNASVSVSIGSNLDGLALIC